MLLTVNGAGINPKAKLTELCFVKRSGSGDCAIKPIVKSSKKCKEETCLCIEKAGYTAKNSCC